MNCASKRIIVHKYFIYSKTFFCIAALVIFSIVHSPDIRQFNPPPTIVNANYCSKCNVCGLHPVASESAGISNIVNKTFRKGFCLEFSSPDVNSNVHSTNNRIATLQETELEVADFDRTSHTEQKLNVQKKFTNHKLSSDVDLHIRLLYSPSTNEAQTSQPTDCNESDLWQYGMHNNSSSAQNGRCNSISVKQIGLKTGTEILQLGEYNRAISVQRGSDLHLTNIQSGEFNYSNDWQEGSYNNILLIQSGSSNFHMGTQIGTDNQLTIIQTN